MATVGVLTFICVSEDTFERGVAYTFLGRVADELVKDGLQVRTGEAGSRDRSVGWCPDCCCRIELVCVDPMP